MIRVVYATKSPFKQAEVAVICAEQALGDGTLVGSRFDFRFRPVSTVEDLEVDISAMVRSEAFKAYERLQVPCIVEHAGLVWRGDNFPGGLTKAMWNELGEDFLTETRSAGVRATARACVGYCDGMEIRVFTGETQGRIADSFRGDRKFYWDTVFIPDDPDTGQPGESTYAEMAARPDGLADKVLRYSQSTRALVKFLEYRLTAPPEMWFE